MYTNCDTLTNKFDELELNVSINNPDIIIINEVLPKYKRYIIHTSEIEINGYKLYTNNFDDKDIRGVAIYIKRKIISSQTYINDSARDTVWVQIETQPNKHLLVGGIYRSPNNNTDQNNIFWKNISNATEQNKNHILLVGDFNCKEINWEDISTTERNTESVSNKLIETVRDCYLEQSVTENTRARGTDTPSLLDLILSYDNNQITNIQYLSPIGLSDHSIITFVYQVESETCEYKVKRYFYDKGDYKSMRAKLDEVNWVEIFENKTIQQQWVILSDILQELEDVYIPNKLVTVDGEYKYKDALPQHILKQIARKHNAWKRYMETRLAKKYKIYCRARNKVKSMVKHFRKEREKGISCNIKENPKAFWKYIKSKSSTKPKVSKLCVDPKDSSSQTTNDSESKANILNSYFATVFTHEPLGEVPSLDPRQTDEQKDIDISQEKIRTLLLNLKISKSPGPDNIHPRVLSELCNQLCIPLTQIYKGSMQQAIIPHEWKLARVSAIHKKGKQTLASNYRPVSITSIVCRVMETIIRDDIVKFIDENNLLSDFQFGFWKGRSTNLQILNVLNDWTTNMEDKFNTECIYLDYQKAFDSVPHKRLISKLYAYKINSKLIQWIQNYLENRQQYVEITGKK